VGQAGPGLRPNLFLLVWGDTYVIEKTAAVLYRHCGHFYLQPAVIITAALASFRLYDIVDLICLQTDNFLKLIPLRMVARVTRKHFNQI